MIGYALIGLWRLVHDIQMLWYDWCEIHTIMCKSDWCIDHIVSTQELSRYTGYRPLHVVWSTVVIPSFRIPFRRIWSLSSNNCNGRSDIMVIRRAGSFLVVTWQVKYYFIQKNKENVAWLIKANRTDECKQLLTQRLFKVVLFFLLICFITTPFPKGVACCRLDIGTHQSICIDFTRGLYGHTVCGLLVLAFGTAVCSIQDNLTKQTHTNNLKEI